MRRAGDSHFVAFVAPPTLKANGQDLLISVRVLNGALEAIYVAIDERFPLRCVHVLAKFKPVRAH